MLRPSRRFLHATRSNQAAQHDDRVASRCDLRTAADVSDAEPTGDLLLAQHRARAADLCEPRRVSTRATRLSPGCIEGRSHPRPRPRSCSARVQAELVAVRVGQLDAVNEISELGRAE
jgi:hypothetical protein